MAVKAKKMIVCIGVIAYTLVSIAPVEAVLCLAPNGHVAIEPEHDKCCAHSCNGIASISIKPAPVTVLVHPCCIDIPLPARLHPCTVDVNKPHCDPGPTDAPCVQPVDPAEIGRLIPAIAGPRIPDPPTATIVLLI